MGENAACLLGEGGARPSLTLVSLGDSFPFPCACMCGAPHGGRPLHCLAGSGDGRGKGASRQAGGGGVGWERGWRKRRADSLGVSTTNARGARRPTRERRERTKGTANRPARARLPCLLDSLAFPPRLRHAGGPAKRSLCQGSQQDAGVSDDNSADPLARLGRPLLLCLSILPARCLGPCPADPPTHTTAALACCANGIASGPRACARAYAVQY